MAHIYLCNQIFIIKNFKLDHLAHLEMRFLYWQNKLCIIYLRSQASFTRDLHQKIKSCIVTVKNFSNNSSYFFFWPCLLLNVVTHILFYTAIFSEGENHLISLHRKQKKRRRTTEKHHVDRFYGSCAERIWLQNSIREWCQNPEYSTGNSGKTLFVTHFVLWFSRTLILLKKLLYVLQWKTFVDLESDEKCFLFILNALFVLKIFKSLSWLFGHVEKMTWLEI